MERAREVSRRGSPARAPRPSGRRCGGPRGARRRARASRATPASGRASSATRPPRRTPCSAWPSAPTAGCSPSWRRAPSTRRAAARSRTAGWSRPRPAARAWSTCTAWATTRRWRSSRSRARSARGRPRARSSSATAGWRPCATTRPRTCCTRRCASGSARTCARRAPTSARTSCASTSRTASGSRAEDLAEVERLVGGWLASNHPVRAIETTRDEAERLGAMALFGEKYGERVRMVEIEGVSRELCGGTHVRATSEIGLFHVTTETSSASNVRRIEAVTGPEAARLFQERTRMLARDRVAAERARARGGEGGRPAERAREGARAKAEAAASRRRTRMRSHGRRRTRTACACSSKAVPDTDPRRCS